MNVSYLELLHALLPEASLVIGALLVLGFDLVAGRRLAAADRVRASTVIGLLAIAAAIYHSVHAGTDGEAFGGVIALDTLSRATRVGVLGLAAFTLLLLPGVLSLRNAGGTQAEHSQHMLGKAMDIKVPGLSTVELRNIATCLKGGGVGYYAEDEFVHVDIARVRYWPSHAYLAKLKCN